MSMAESSMAGMNGLMGGCVITFISQAKIDNNFCFASEIDFDFIAQAKIHESLTLCHWISDVIAPLPQLSISWEINGCW